MVSVLVLFSIPLTVYPVQRDLICYWGANPCELVTLSMLVERVSMGGYTPPIQEIGRAMT